MIDEKKLIKKLQTEIDSFIKKNSNPKNCEPTKVLKEFMHILELEAMKQKNGWIPCGERLPDAAGCEVLATLENKDGQRRCEIVFMGYGDSRWHCNHKEIDLNFWKVIAWMPLPKSYKESEV